MISNLKEILKQLMGGLVLKTGLLLLYTLLLILTRVAFYGVMVLLYIGIAFLTISSPLIEKLRRVIMILHGKLLRIKQ